MILEFKEHELAEGEDMWNVKSYPGYGLYFIEYAGQSHLVSVTGGSNSCVMSMLISYKIIKDNTANRLMIDNCENLKLDAIEPKLSPLHEFPQYYTEEKIDGNTLLKAIAIAQNPELATSLIKD